MAVKTTEFDPRGDIKLKIGRNDSDPVLLTACSRTLARVSPVFERMLYGNFAEARKTTDDWIVNLPEDKHEPLAIFLNIAHCQFHHVPRILTVDEFYDITVLTNYYDSTRILVPWIGRWMGTLEEEAKGSNETMAKALWVSWEVGQKVPFSRIAMRMILESDGGLTAEHALVQELRMPPDIIERITEIRLSIIQALLNVFHNLIEHLIVVDEKPRWCRHAEWMGPHRCESMILGSLTFCLARAGLWPLPSPEDAEDSINTLRRKMTGLIIHDIGQGRETPKVDHRGCNPERFLLEEFGVIFDDIPDPVSEFHVKKMDEQVKKLIQL